MTEIINSDRYITQETLTKCFSQGKYNYIDKVICGNGFSTAFINNKPPRGKINIIIAPNRAVVISKEAQYRANPTGTKMKFFYKDSTDLDFTEAEVLMFVADSFLLMSERLYWIRDSINWVLIDEAHSVEIQSSFRRVLIDFTAKVRKLIGEAPVLVSVTATPNLYTPVTFRIKNDIVTPVEITLVNDFEASVERVKKLLEDGEKVVIATNNKNVIYRLKDANSVLEADYTIGEGLSTSLSELITIKQNSESNLKIISSRGFEGFDILGEDFNVFFYEDRGSVQGFETFYIANLYQAINRVRAGAKYVEYCRKEVVNARPVIFDDIDKDVQTFIDRTDLSIHNKQSKSHSKGFYIYHPYLIFTQDINPESRNYGEFSVKKNEENIRLYKESVIYDKPFPSEEFNTFLQERQISVINKCEVPRRLRQIRLRDEYKEQRLLTNVDFIDDLDLFGEDFYLKPEYRETIVDYRAILTTYLRRKNYAGLRRPTDREEAGLKLLSNLKEFDKVLAKFTKVYNERSINKYGLKASKKYRESFKKQSLQTLCKLILIFCNEKIRIPSNWIANRDYNILTDIGIPEIEYIASIFGVETTEVDVNSAFIRIIYSINGLDLPANFYGENKENKKLINTFLNNFFYNPKQKTSKAMQKKRAVDKFTKLGFEPIVIKYLIDNFFLAKYRGELFNFLTFYEKQIVSNLKLVAVEDFDTEGFGRRHDSLILFNNQSNLERLNHLEFLNREGWFKIVEQEKLLTRQEEVLEFFEFQKDL